MSEKIKEIIQKIEQAIPQLEQKKNLRDYKELEMLKKALSNPDKLITMCRAANAHLEGEDCSETTIWNAQINIRGKATQLEYLCGDLAAEIREEEKSKK